jgi:glycosyltransferase involved in cell wall biosynthesis
VLTAAFKISRQARIHHYDILHYFFSLPTGFLSLLPGAHQKIPYFVSLRGSDVPHYDRYNKKLEIAHFLLHPLSRIILKRASQVIAVTNSLKATAKETFPQQPISVIPNGVDDNLFKPQAPRVKSTNPLKMICVARLVPRKGVQHLLEALSDFEDGSVKLTIFGTGVYEPWLKQRCRELSLSHCVTFRGYAPSSQLALQLAASDVFILPSLAEAFGNVFAEAMACGLPIIGTNTGGIPDLVQGENGILVSPGNVFELRQAIRTLKNCRSLRKKMGQANRKKITNQYAWRNIASRFLAAYATASQNGNVSR